MKKSLLFTTAVIMAVSCRSHMNCLVGNINPHPSANLTLNGIEETTAKNMHENFMRLRNQDIRPTRQSVWFDSATIHKMVTLLINEKGGKQTLQQPDVKDKTDGMRIYFVSSANLKYGHLVNSLTMISTKNEGPEDPTYPDSYQNHLDYYNHDINDPLFKNLDSITGQVEVRPFLNVFQGQNLYNTYRGDDALKPGNNPHYVSRQKAHMMVNYFGKDPITTESEWFDIKFLAILDSIPHDGIRIYFTRHRSSYIGGAPDPDALKEAFVLVPTVKKGGYHKDNFVSKDIDAFIKNTAAARKKTNIARLGIFQPAADTTGGFDNGEICPTHCN